MSSSPGGAPDVTRKQRLLLRVERVSRRHWAAVFAVALAAVVASSWLGSRLRLESDALQLIPRGNRQIDTFKRAIKEFGSIDFLLVLLEAGPGEGPDELEDFADVFAEKLRAEKGLVESIEYRFLPDAAFLKLFSENALLFLPPEQLPALAARLEDDAILRQIRDNRAALASPTATLTGEMIHRDPLGLMPLFMNRLLGHRGALQLDLSDGYYLAQDGRSLILLVKPAGPSQNLDFDRRLLDAARRGAEETRRELEEDSEAEADTTVNVAVSYSGNYAMVLEESRLIKSDASRNVLISLFAVSALYWLCYRRFAALLYSTVPLMVGQALTFAVAYFVLGRLNAASASFTALLMGLGTDFTIVMYARYVEERQRGADLADATERMVGEAGLGVFTGAITSAGTFYALCVSQFGGLFDLGLLIGTGILLCAVVIVFLLPAMIAWNEGVRRRKEDVVRKLHLQSFGLEHLLTLCSRHRTATIVAVAALTAAGGLAAAGLDFDDTLQALRSPRSEPTRVQARIADRFGASLSYMMAIAEGVSLDEAVARTQRIEERLKPWVENRTIGSSESILTYLPPASQQRSVIEAVRAGRTSAFDVKRIEATFLRGLEENGFRREAFVDYLDLMRRFLAPDRPITLDDLVSGGLGRIVDRYVDRDERTVRIVTYLYPTDPRWKREPPPGLAEALSAGDPGIVVTGTNVVGAEMRKIFVRDAVLAVALGLALVFLLLLADFRSLRLTAVSMAQLLTGVAMMLGLMRLFGIPINYVNAFVSTMILGVGIDYSIHLVHRMSRTRGQVDAGVLETGKAVVMAALTNVAGFGTLILGNYPALRSLGTVALFGSVTCLLTSLTLVPALMQPRRPGHS